MKDRLSIIISMIIFGTIGLFVRYIDLPSSIIACSRGFIGGGLLYVWCLLNKKRIVIKTYGKSIIWLLLSGAAIGVNWIFLFEAYRYTTVAVATLCYYMQPVIITITAPWILKEKMSVGKLICIIVAILGMIPISGILTGNGYGNLWGIVFGQAAALFYSIVIIINKKYLVEVPAIERTAVQLISAAVALLPYCLVTQRISTLSMNTTALCLLLFVGLFHTGITYCLYFGSLNALPAQSCAIMSYIDPVVAVLISMLILHEGFDIFTIIGSIMIIGAAFVSETMFSSKEA